MLPRLQAATFSRKASSANGGQGLSWTLRKRDAVERAAGIGADAQLAAERLRDAAEPPEEPSPQAAETAGPLLGAGCDTKTHGAAGTQESPAAEGGEAAAREVEQRPSRRQAEVPIGAFQRLPQVGVMLAPCPSPISSSSHLTCWQGERQAFLHHHVT